MKTLVNWKDQATQDKYEKERNRHRRRNHRITYDCQNAKAKGERCICNRGKILNSASIDGSMYLLAVVRGRTSFQCKSCLWFTKGD
jgi:hypothetical protein